MKKIYYKKKCCRNNIDYPECTNNTHFTCKIQDEILNKNPIIFFLWNLKAG